MKRRKLALTLLSCFVSATTLMTACGTNKTTSDTPISEKTVEPLGKYDTTVNVNIAMPIDSNAVLKDGQKFDNNNWLKMLESDYGIKISFPFQVDGSQYKNKLNVVLASGDIPDIIVCSDMSQLQQLVDSEQIADITSIYDKWATPFTKQQMISDGNLALSACKFNGKLMALPSICDPRPGLMFMRKDWLDKLGLTEPKTMDDVLKISEAFTKKDPDGNGKDDSIGIAYGNVIWGSVGDFASFSNAYHAYPSQWVKGDDGKVYYGSVQPEMKKVLGVLQGLYKSGQIDKEFSTKDSGKVAEQLAASKAGIVFGQWWMPSWPLQGVKDKDPKADWRAYPVPSADDKSAKVQFWFTGGPFFAVRKDYKNPELLVKMMNIWFDKVYDKNSDFLKWGIGADGSQYFKFMPVYSWPGEDLRGRNINEALKTKDSSKLTSEEKTYYDAIVKYHNGDNSQWFQYANYGEISAQRILSDVYFANKLVVPPAFYGAPTKTMVDKKASLDKMETETFFKIIMGAASVDEFDNFVAQWKQLGGEQITKEVNEWAAAHK